MTPWGQDSRSEAWFWEVSGKCKRSRLPPEYSPTAHICAGTPFKFSTRPEKLASRTQRKQTRLFSLLRRSSGRQRRPKRVGSDEIWDKAEAALAEATKLAGLDYILNPGEGAFYGPKLEFTLKDSLGRDWQCGTIQVDFNLPMRLGAEYVGKDNQKHVPVMLHRAAVGSIERFLGILIEEFMGDFPLWLAPVQARVLPISEKFADYAKQVERELVNAGVRVEVDESNEKLGYKIRQCELQKIPYKIIVGEKEQAEGLIAVNKRKEGDKGQMTVAQFLEMTADDRKVVR